MLAPSRQPPTPRTILVVDDHPDVRGLLRALIARAAPDLILLDLAMPTADGVAVCRRVKADPATRALPVVMLTGAIPDAERQRGLDAGADAYITKPFRPLSLLDQIDAHLAAGKAGRRGHRRLRSADRAASIPV